jgi:HEAT repeat protein
MKNLLGLALAALAAAAVLGCGEARWPDLGKQVERWIQGLHDPDARVRKRAVFKLGNVGPRDAAVFPAVVGALKDRDAGVRCEAILAVVKFGKEGREALPALDRARRHDPSAEVRSYAARAVEKLRAEEGPAAAP